MKRYNHIVCRYTSHRNGLCEFTDTFRDDKDETVSTLALRKETQDGGRNRFKKLSRRETLPQARHFYETRPIFEQLVRYLTLASKYADICVQKKGRTSRRCIFV